MKASLREEKHWKTCFASCPVVKGKVQRTNGKNHLMWSHLVLSSSTCQKCVLVLIWAAGYQSLAIKLRASICRPWKNSHLLQVLLYFRQQYFSQPCRCGQGTWRSKCVGVKIATLGPAGFLFGRAKQTLQVHMMRWPDIFALQHWEKIQPPRYLRLICCILKHLHANGPHLACNQTFMSIWLQKMPNWLLVRSDQAELSHWSDLLLFISRDLHRSQRNPHLPMEVNFAALSAGQ